MHMATEFLCKIWHLRAGKVYGPLTLAERVSSSPQNGSASIRGAGVYGQLTTTSNTSAHVCYALHSAHLGSC
jgi:hypothetical protein